MIQTQKPVSLPDIPLVSGVPKTDFTSGPEAPDSPLPLRFSPRISGNNEAVKRSGEKLQVVTKKRSKPTPTDCGKTPKSSYSNDVPILTSIDVGKASHCSHNDVVRKPIGRNLPNRKKKHWHPRKKTNKKGADDN